uniref:Uncharacterized protein n=1 Tax=Ananas comosus var. bracteatus TaxID=296719 RepID=A0A6V7NGG0_ANACO|nr:unnamed protein product [Ananas comosus var. bracteatus]
MRVPRSRHFDNPALPLEPAMCRNICRWPTRAAPVMSLSSTQKCPRGRLELVDHPWIHARVANLRIEQDLNSVLWRWSPDGRFSVKSTYLVLSDGGTRDTALTRSGDSERTVTIKIRANRFKSLLVGHLGGSKQYYLQIKQA